MKFVRALAAVVVLAGSAVGFSAPAQAEQILEGRFSFTSEGKTGFWDIYPSCVPVVGDLREPLYLPVGCRLKISPSVGLSGGDARLVGGQWAFSRPRQEGIRCADGSWEATVETVKFDDVTLTGTSNVSHTGACGTAPGIITTPFTLAYVGPLPIPVDQYPLICEPGGLRRCF